MNCGQRGLTLRALAALAFCAAVGVASGQDNEGKLVPLVKTDFDVTTWLTKAETRIEEKNYSRAIEILQALIEGDSGFVAVDDKHRRFVAMREAATDLIGKLPPEGLALYRDLYNVRAASKLLAAINAGDLRAMDEVAGIYRHTPAGQEALEKLGGYFFDRGRFAQAVHYWQRRLAAAGTEDKPAMLAKTLTALHLAGRSDQARELLKTLKETFPDAQARFAGEDRNLVAFSEAMLKREPMAKVQARQLTSIYPGWGGLPDGMAVMANCEFVLMPQWQSIYVDTEAPVSDQLIARDVLEDMGGQQGREYVGYAELRDGQVVLPKDVTNRSRQASNVHALPGIIRPVVTDQWVIYRTDDRVVAVDRETGQLAWDTWEMLPMERAPEQNTSRNRAYYSSSGTTLIDRGRYGLTIGGAYVYTVWDFPFDDPDLHGRMRGDVSGGAEASSLTALELGREGYAAWTVGHSGNDEALKGALFVSLPTYQSTGPGSGRLYVMMMQTENYYLACLDPHDHGKLLWKAEIAQSPTSQTRGQLTHFDRLKQVGSPPAVVGGRVFATTNAGVLAAFDAENGKGLWACQYDSNLNVGQNSSRARTMYSRMMQGDVRSRVNPILVSDGIVLAMPADGGELLALRADDGTDAWADRVEAMSHDSLAAFDSSHVLLVGDGILVVRISDGKVVRRMPQIKPVLSRPAVTSEHVYLAGDGLVYQIDKSTFQVRRLQVAEPGSLLGNLVSAGGQLFAANSLGVSCYSSYALAKDRLSERIEQADGLVKAELLFKRGHLAFVAKEFADALADFQACQTQAKTLEDDLQRHSFVTQLRPRLYRAYVALGNVTRDHDARLEHFQQAMALADSPLETAHMLVRLAKYYEDVGQFDKALATAMRVDEEYADLRLADVDIGQRADVTVTIQPEATTHYGSQWSRDFIDRLVSVHGQDIYAAYDAKARTAIDQALANGDATAMMKVLDAYPHTRYAAEARFKAAELYFVEASRRSGKAANDRLGKARSILLGAIATADDPAQRATIVIGLAAIDIAAGVPESAKRNLNAIGDLSRDLEVSFATYKGTLGEVLEQLQRESNRPPKASGVRILPSLPDELAELQKINDRHALILSDDQGRAIAADEMAFVLKNNELEIWSLGDITAQGAAYAPKHVSVDFDPDVMGQARSDQAPWAAGVDQESGLLWLADGSHVTGVDIQAAKVAHDIPMDQLKLRNIISAAMGEGMLVALDESGTIGTMKLSNGQPYWQSRIRMVNPTGKALRPQWYIQAGVAVLLSNNARDVHVFDLKTGKLVLRERSNVRADVRFTPDGRLILAVDEVISLRETSNDKIREPLARGVLADGNVPDLLAADDENLILHLAGERGVRLLDLSALDTAIAQSLTPRALPSGEAVYPVDATIDAQGVYVFSSLQPHPVAAGSTRLTTGLHVTRFDPESGGLNWDRLVVDDTEHPQRLVSSTHAAGSLLVGVIGLAPDAPSGWWVIDKSDQKPAAEFKMPAKNPRDRTAAARNAELGGVVVVPGRLMLDMPEGPVIYGGK